MTDNINHPEHYCGKIETIDYIRDKLDDTAYRGYCLGNVIKYISRYDKKGEPLQDLKKAWVYLGWAIDTLSVEDKAEPAKEEPKPVKKSHPKKSRIDDGKIRACYEGGRSVSWIADEMNISIPTVREHLKAMGIYHPKKVSDK